MTKIFLIGAARSGTKILRDLLGTHPDFSVIPYDVNFVWRFGNGLHPNDQLEIGSVDKSTRDKIDNFLEKYRRKSSYLVEKTVSNTIRLPFLYSLYPDAKFIFLYRNGLDVCESVFRQWNAQPKKAYLFKKLFHIPMSVWFSYGLSYLRRNIQPSSREYYWGVKYPNMELDLATKDTLYVVAKQWDYCVNKMINDSRLIPESQRIDVNYEMLVKDSCSAFERILRFINNDLSVNDLDLTSLSCGNVGKANSGLNSMEIKKVNSVISDSMRKLGYESES